MRVLYFEGEGGHHFRILRAVKNRFGPTDEIGVFEMTGGGLGEVPNPSELFLGERNAATPGAAVFAGMEGTRPLLVEIQALVAPDRARHAAARGDRLGPEPACHGACRARSPLPGPPRRLRRLPQRRRRPPDQRAGRRPRGRRGAGLLAAWRGAAARLRLFRRDQPVGLDPPGGACRRRGSRRRRSSVSRRAVLPGAAPPAERSTAPAPRHRPARRPRRADRCARRRRGRFRRMPTIDVGGRGGPIFRVTGAAECLGRGRTWP